MRCFLFLLIPLGGLFGCANILGTSDYKPCSGETCDGGDGGGGGSSSSTSSSSSSSTSGDCVMLTVHVSGNVKVKLHPVEAEFSAEFSGPVCIAKGAISLEAVCDNEGGQDPPTTSEWGNDVCPDDGANCDFTLTKDEEFDVVSEDCP